MPKLLAIIRVFLDILLGLLQITMALHQYADSEFPIAVGQFYQLVHFLLGGILFFQRYTGDLFHAVIFSGIGNLFPDNLGNIFMESKVIGIHSLQGTQFAGHMIGVHFVVRRNQSLFVTLIHKGNKSAPFILDPGSLEVVTLGSYQDHNRRRGQCRKNVGFILFAGHTFESFFCKEDLKAFISQMIIQLTGNFTVHSDRPILAGSLVADEHIIRSFLIDNLQKLSRNPINFLGLPLKNSTGVPSGIFQCVEIVLVCKNGITVNSVTVWHFILGNRIDLICNTILTQNDTEMGIRLSVVNIQDLLVKICGFFKILMIPGIVCPAIKIKVLLSLFIHRNIIEISAIGTHNT